MSTPGSLREHPTADAQPSGTSESSSSRQPSQAPAPESKPEASAYQGSYRPPDPGLTSPPEQTVNNAGLPDLARVDTALPPDDMPPPAYSTTLGEITEQNSDLGTNAVVTSDGRIDISIVQKSRRFSQLLAPQIHQIADAPSEEPPPPYIPEFLGGAPGQEPPPPLNVVIHVVGSRGDIQPFVALGKVLKETYRHRVRLATHPTFKDFVRENGLDFFSIGGDPAELMAFMVKNPGLMPGFESLRSGDVGKRRREIQEILRGTWRACIETGDGLGMDPLLQTIEEWMEFTHDQPEALHKPFIADAIIANPPSFGHVHCAEKLGIPLHMMFTMPWSPTQAFPHPLANIQASNADQSVTNFMSYALVDMLTWQGLGDIINNFRRDSLGLDSVSMMWAPGMLTRLKIPYTYCWSPALIPKPKDWPSHISISGFFFLPLAQSFTPDPELAAFLEAGDPPVYIGFGSIVVDDPNAMTSFIFDAVKKTGRRALVSKGWGGLGASEIGIPEGVYMVGNVPHDWLFQRVACVVHHGGAGTTAAGIAAGKPTVVIPFFGDQPFWGAMTARAGAGPQPVPYKSLTVDKLADAILEALKPQSLAQAQELSNKIRAERGDQIGAQSFHQMLKVDELRCLVAPKRAAAWRVKRTQVKLSAVAATVLAQEGEINFSELKLLRSREYETDEGPWDPLTGGATAIMGTLGTMMMGVADLPIETLKRLNIHPDSKKNKQAQHSPDTGSSNRDSHGRVPTLASATSSSTSLPAGRSSGGSLTETTPLSSVQSPRQSSSLEMDRGATPSPNERVNFMAQAMRASTQVSRSRSRSPSRADNCPISSYISEHTAHHRTKSNSIPERHSIETRTRSTLTFSEKVDSTIREAKGIARIAAAGAKAPMDFSMNVAKGFHNVPKLYGEEVRPVDRVTDAKSGFRTAAKELGLGFFDGITGVVMNPVRGAKKNGGAGFIKGVGTGLAGIPIRIMGGVFAVPGYAMHGLFQEALKSRGAHVQNYIVAARVSQGYNETASLSERERVKILERWRSVKVGVQKKKAPGEEQFEVLHTLMKQRRAKKHARKENVKSGFFHHGRGASPVVPPALDEEEPHNNMSHITPESAGRGSIPLHHSQSYPQPQPTSVSLQRGREADGEERQLESAIQASVSQASHGDAAEDEMLARAMRASVSELERAEGEHADDEAALQRALQASADEMERSGAKASAEEQRLLTEALRRSSTKTKHRGDHTHSHGSDSEWDSSDDDVQWDRVVAESKELHHLHQHFPDEYDRYRRGIPPLEPERHDVGAGAHEAGDDELTRALEESRHAEDERRKAQERERTEEDIVLEYVKKQSLAEQEHRHRKDDEEAVSAVELATGLDPGSSSQGADMGMGRDDKMVVEHEGETA